ncbi:hypothetical protein RN001_010923 [Aquatica leii]|uniref:2-(3-amino-3-carboxypropyl)histidine synthase n=1 Tax=Aquatica leii TaxID=1421715 RepID=A0AAN7SES3_9COLE|nr:hypothetical protein RN001_010923 [Aquatica leii]
MSANFFTNDAIIIERQIDDLPKLVSTNPDELSYIYEIDNCVKWIQNHNFKKVCLQFPDYMLTDASEVAKSLQNRLQQTVYILGDTAYESCCIDYIAAAHVEADAIIHFGPVCFSKPTETTPCLRIFEKYPLDLNKLRLVLTNHANSIIVLDTPYAVHANLIRQTFNNLIVITDDFVHTASSVIIVGNNLRKILNFKLAHKLTEVFYYDPITTTLTNYDEDLKVLKRRHFLVETIKDSITFGIIIGTVSVKNYFSAIERVKKLIRVHGKKYYVISVGKPTVAKLANFLEIDVYVVITCGMNEIYDSRDFYKPIVTPYDMETALNPHWKDSHFSYDFNSYLTDLEISKEDVDNMLDDVSLITGKVRTSVKGMVVEDVGSEVATRESGALALNTNFGAGFLSQRGWKGLEQNLGCDQPDTVSEGRRGIAQGYQNETL